MERIRAAARAWLGHIGDLDHSPVVVPFGDPDGVEQRARYELARVLRDELFEPVRHGPIFVWSGEYPLDGRSQHWGGPDIWRCDEHPDWEGEELGTWDSYWSAVANDKDRVGQLEADARREWEEQSVEAHAALHGVEIS